MSYRTAFLVLVVVSLVLGGALGYAVSAPDRVTTTVTSTATQGVSSLVPELSNVTVAETVDTYLTSGPIDIGLDRGTFGSAGLTVNLIVTTNALQALEAGQVQFALSPPAFAADAEGGDIISVGTTVTNYPAAIIARPGITSISQLEGKPLGCLTAGELICILATIMVKSENWTESPSLIEPLGTISALEAAFESGQVQGFIYDWGLAVQLQSQGQATILGSVTQFVPQWYPGTVLTTTQFASAHPNTVRLFLSALYQSQLWLTENSNATEQWLVSHYGYDLEAAQTVYNNTQFSLTGIMNPSVIEFMYNETASALNLPAMNWQSTYTNEYLPTITYSPA